MYLFPISSTLCIKLLVVHSTLFSLVLFPMYMHTFDEIKKNEHALKLSMPVSLKI